MADPTEAEKERREARSAFADALNAVVKAVEEELTWMAAGGAAEVQILSLGLDRETAGSTVGLHERCHQSFVELKLSAAPKAEDARSWLRTGLAVLEISPAAIEARLPGVPLPEPNDRLPGVPMSVKAAPDRPVWAHVARLRTEQGRCPDLAEPCWVLTLSVSLRTLRSQQAEPVEVVSVNARGLRQKGEGG